MTHLAEIKVRRWFARRKCIVVQPYRKVLNSVNALLILLAFLTLIACGSQDDNLKQSSLEPKNPLGTNPEVCEQQKTQNPNWNALASSNCFRLSDYNLFEKLTPNQYEIQSPGFLYELSSALFTDYARKYRYIFLPPDTVIHYQKNDSFRFPIGSVLVKLFALPVNTAQHDENIIEIRLLIHRQDGWIPLTYHWDDALNEAYLSLTQRSIESSIVHENVALLFDYNAPARSQCATCHIDQSNDNKAFITPIGPKAHLLNKMMPSGRNQLEEWQDREVIQGLPSDLSSIDTAPNWRDESASLNDRAKSYLDINCAHCHNDKGSAALSGLRLEFWRKTIDYTHGRCNPAHGWRGGGFDISPGDGENSSIPRRMRHTAAKDRMPPIGRSLVDEEAAQLIEDWIDSMTFVNCSP